MVTEKTLVRIKALLVEDEPVCMDAVKTILSFHGATVTTAGSAEEAIQQKNPTGFDVIITDINLPGMDGISLLRHIRKLNPDVPVIIITGYSSISSAIEALKLGAQDYLVKPIGNGSQLISAVKQSAEHYKLILKNSALQEELKQSEETFRALFHNASDAIFLHTRSDSDVPSVFTEVNDVACSRLGYTRNELLSMTLLDITAPEHRGNLAHAMETVSDMGHATFETMHVSKNGTRIPVEINTHLFSMKGVRVVLSIARDIAERREEEQMVVKASEREARQIGQELHDVLCQDLASMKMLATLLKTALKSESREVKRDIELISNLASTAVTRARSLCEGLFPSELEREGLAPALTQLASNQEELFKVKCSFKDEYQLEIADKSVALHLYRIAQQAVNNAVMHGKAEHVSITLKKSGPGVVLTIKDDGTGIAPSSHSRNGMGLLIMQHRARIIGAALTISSSKDGGAMSNVYVTTLQTREDNP